MSPLQSIESKKLWKATKEEENLKLGFSIHIGHIPKEMWPKIKRENSKRKLFLHNKYNGHYYFSSSTTRKEKGGNEKELTIDKELFCNQKRQTDKNTHKYMM